MKPPTSARPFSALVLLLVLLAVAGEASAEHSRKGRYHHTQHHQHEGHEHRASRNRREQDPPAEVTTAGSGDDPPGTDAPSNKAIPCTKPEDCLELLKSICDTKINFCRCPVPYPIIDEENKQCLKDTSLNHTCQFSIQCRNADHMSLCNEAGICVCQEGYKITDLSSSIGLSCISTKSRSSVNSAMIGVVAGLGLMFVIICVVLRLFSKARFRENRSIFNTPNPRLMNASLFKDSKLLSPARGERRGSRASVRVPSRAPSVTSVNAASRSPNGSLAKGGRRGSAMSTVSATGSASAAPAPQHQKKQPPASAKTEAPIKDTSETTVAIETVD